jgi:hypothetical protein
MKAFLPTALGLNALGFETMIGLYSRHEGELIAEHDMVHALLRVLCKKIEKYKNRPPTSTLDEFHLFMHYDKAYIYNTPVKTVWFKFEDAAQAARRFIKLDPGQFNKIFLFFALDPGEKVFQLFPVWLKVDLLPMGRRE